LIADCRTRRATLTEPDVFNLQSENLQSAIAKGGGGRLEVPAALQAAISG